MSLAKGGGTRLKECPLASVWVHKSYPRRSPLRNVSRIPVPPGHPLEPSLQGQSFRVPASRQMWSFGGRQGDSCLAFLGCWALWGRDRPEPLWTSLPRSPEHQSRLTSPWGEVRHRWPFFPVVLPHKVLSSPKKRILDFQLLFPRSGQSQDAGLPVLFPESTIARKTSATSGLGNTPGLLWGRSPFLGGLLPENTGALQVPGTSHPQGVECALTLSHGSPDTTDPV